MIEQTNAAKVAPSKIARLGILDDLSNGFVYFTIMRNWPSMWEHIAWNRRYKHARWVKSCDRGFHASQLPTVVLLRRWQYQAEVQGAVLAGVSREKNKG